MRIGMKRVAANTHDIYTRWGLMDPREVILEKLGLKIDEKLDDKHRINKDIRPEVYVYSVNATKDDQPYSLEIAIEEKDTDLSAMMNCKVEWCKRMVVVVRENKPAA